MTRDRRTHATAEEYAGRCRALVVEWSPRLPSDDVDWAMHLIDHDEPAEGLCWLAWSIDDARIIPAAAEIHEIRRLIDDVVPESSLPESFRASAGQ